MKGMMSEMRKQAELRSSTLLDEIMTLDVFDTHTHLVGDRLAAQDFWEIAHYFWLNREMQAAGYPAQAQALAEDKRIEAFVAAYQATRNTWMNMALTHIMKDLYGIVLHDRTSVHEAIEAVRATALQSAWPQSVADKGRVRRFTVNHPEHAAFADMRDNACLIPRIDNLMRVWIEDIQQAGNSEEALQAVYRTIDSLLDEYSALGCPGIMTTLPAYAALALDTTSLHPTSRKDEVLMVLLHKVCSEVERRGMLLQIFVGVEKGWSANTSAPVNDPLRILKLHGFFERYSHSFELVVASDINNLDVVQAAWLFPNVHVGGMWWFNFRPSTYRASMLHRLEALPAIKSALVVSDARCIEWTYGKIVLVRKLLAQVLEEQVRTGWLDRETALYVAREWLHDSAARLYGS